jgi:hypothetical protein
MYKPFYVVFFEDGSHIVDRNPFVGGRWKMIPNKKIVRMDYIIGNTKFTLDGYEGYNHFYYREGILQVNSKITQFGMMGVYQGAVQILEFDIKQNKVGLRKCNFGQEGYKSKPLSGWREGCKGLEPKHYYCKIENIVKE